MPQDPWLAFFHNSTIVQAMVISKGTDQMRAQMAQTVIVLAATLALSGCGGAVTNRPAAADLKLKTGLYKIEAVQGTRAAWHDAMIVGDGQADSFLENALRNFQSRMLPSNGASSWQANDRPCEVYNFVPTGGTFTATGECRIVSEGKTTSFTYTGTSFGDGFSINVERSGFGTRVPGKPDNIVISGKWERATEQQSGATDSMPDAASTAQSYDREEADSPADTSDDVSSSSDE